MNPAIRASKRRIVAVKQPNLPQYTDTELEQYRKLVFLLGSSNVSERSGVSHPSVKNFRDATKKTWPGIARQLVETLDEMAMELLAFFPPKLIMKKTRQLLDAQKAAAAPAPASQQ